MREDALTFLWTGENGFDADFARMGGKADFCRNAEVKADERFGHVLSCEDRVCMAWRAPGNLYARAGAVSFYWRAGDPMDATPFPIFRVGYADHSSWDAVFLRIDWNDGGFEAFITDINLSRYTLRAPITPAADAFTHLHLSWQENGEMALYVNGLPADKCEIRTVLDAGLDRFGLHGRAVSHWNVSSSFNFIRSGDFADIRLYDRPVLPDGTPCGEILSARKAAILHQYGLDAENLPEISGDMTVRKVEIHDAYDEKRWWYKGMDGIRETSWPGVFNRSRLRGRDDVFQLPDWDCYSTSGKRITFHLPDEPINCIQIAGSASGCADLDGQALFVRQMEQERSSHVFAAVTGGRLTFENEWIEEPIGDLTALYLTRGIPAELSVRTAKGNAPQSLIDHIAGRFGFGERTVLGESAQALPVYHLIAPLGNDRPIGLDGAQLKWNLAAPARFSVLVRDPILPYRSLLWFTFRAGGGAHTLFLDTRDRVLQKDACLYVLLVCDRNLDESELAQLNFAPVCMPAEKAKAQHGQDRFTQVRDVYGHLTEESPADDRFALLRRWQGDLADLLSACPDHKGGLTYLYTAKWRKLMQTKLIDEALACFDAPFDMSEKPDHMPAWAHEQLCYLEKYDELIRFWVENRQIQNGELGGGLSDDGDFTAMWVPLIQMGVDPAYYLKSLEKCLDAFYDQGMFLNGLPAIRTDDLHSSEEGLVTLAQALTANNANPKNLERAMETARGAFWLTGVNGAGHRHIRSSFFSGSVLAENLPWGTSGPDSYLALTPIWLLAKYNRNEKALMLLRELADGLLAHWRGGKLYSQIDFETDADHLPKSNHGSAEFSLLWAAYALLGDEKYLAPVRQVPLAPLPDRQTADDDQIAKRYHELNRQAYICAYYNTLGYPWVDRVFFENMDIQYDRLGGVGFLRFNAFYPRHRFEWRFSKGGAFDFAAKTIGSAQDRVEMDVYCLKAICAELIGAQITRGLWRINGAQPVLWGEGLPLSVQLASGSSRICLELVSPQADPAAYDLGVGPEDLKFFAHGLNVTVHSLGSAPTPEAKIALMRGDTVLRTAQIPPMEAPNDLRPRTWDIAFYLHGLSDLTGCCVVIDPDGALCEISRANNRVIISCDVRDMRQKSRRDL